MLSSFKLLVVALVALSAHVDAQGIRNNAAPAAVIMKQSVALSPGKYKVQNYATKHWLQFFRTKVTNSATRPQVGTVVISQGSKHGKSGKKTATYSGTIVSGGGKCLSAQFTNGLDTAAVSYSCKANGQGGTASLEVAKQFWRLVPCGKVSFTAKPTGTKKKTTTKKAAAKCKKTGAWLNKHSTYVTKLGHSECKASLTAYRKAHSKRSTHSDMARLVRRRIEEEQSNDLEARNVADDESLFEERSEHLNTFEERSFAEGEADEAERTGLEKRSLVKRATSGTYCIIAVDHLTDMKTRAVGSQTVTTVGGYKSMKMVDYNKADPKQWWVFTKA